MEIARELWPENVKLIWTQIEISILAPVASLFSGSMEAKSS